jgi:hypothetical protein
MNPENTGTCTGFETIRPKPDPNWAGGTSRLHEVSRPPILPDSADPELFARVVAQQTILLTQQGRKIIDVVERMLDRVGDDVGTLSEALTILAVYLPELQGMLVSYRNAERVLRRNQDPRRRTQIPVPAEAKQEGSQSHENHHPAMGDRGDG